MFTLCQVLSPHMDYVSQRHVPRSPNKVGSIDIPILQMRQLSTKKFKELNQKSCSQEDKTRFSAGLSDPKPVCSHCAILWQLRKEPERQLQSGGKAQTCRWTDR